MHRYDPTDVPRRILPQFLIIKGSIGVRGLRKSCLRIQPSRLYIAGTLSATFIGTTVDLGNLANGGLMYVETRLPCGSI